MPRTDDLDALAALVAHGDVVVLSGAGLSTDSGIPDYRGPSGAARRATPMTYQVFTSSGNARRRYWARSHLGWRVVARAEPNAGHAAVDALHRSGIVSAVITQNVDGLHTAAGTPDVVELHGNLSRVVCLDCAGTTSRAEHDARLRAVNRAWRARVLGVNPDGDAEIADEALDRFRVVDCGACGGVLKPDVVFFGETVPAPRVATCFGLVDRAQVLLVLGSSLTVMSGYRFVLHALKRGVPVAIVNGGSTRGDDKATVKVDGPLSQVLPALVHRLEPVPAG